MAATPGQANERDKSDGAASEGASVPSFKSPLCSKNHARVHVPNHAPRLGAEAD